MTSFEGRTPLQVAAALLLLGMAAVLATSSTSTSTTSTSTTSTTSTSTTSTTSTSTTSTTNSQESGSLTHNGTFECDLTNSSSCDEGQCCVKKVSWRLEDDHAGVEVSTECQDLLTAGKLCLVKPQGYLCDCGPGLVCRTKRNEDFGHCAKA